MIRKIINGILLISMINLSQIFASNGLGITIEPYGSFNASTSGGSFLQSSDTATSNSQKVEHQSLAMNGFGFGGQLGFDISNNLAAMIGYHHQRYSSRKFSYASSTSLNNDSRVFTSQYNLFTLGLRPSIKALGGTFRAGVGFVISTPFDLTYTTQRSGALVTSNTSAKTQLMVNNYNIAMGVYGELGYAYNLTDSLYLSLGLRLIAGSADNENKTTVETDTFENGNSTVTTTTHESSISTDDKTSVTSTSGNVTNITKKAAPSSVSISNFSATFAIGYRL